MHLTVVLRIVGVFLMIFSLTMLPPTLVALYYEDGAANTFFIAFIITLGTGLMSWLPVQKNKSELRTRDGFFVVVLFWSVLALFGCLPLLLYEPINMSFTDAFFESISGLTTTGATVINNLDQLPKSILYYRQQLQWLGGMGIIVLAVAVLPMLGIGGMQLYRAETPGPVKDSKLTPRITETAKTLWYIYVFLTTLCAIAYWAAGMTLFDAICHSFSTVAIGGFSTHDASLGYFNSASIEIVAIIFMLLSGVNFALHFFAWRRKSVFHYFRDPEARLFFSAIFIIALLTCVGLKATHTYDNWADSIRYGVFESVSIATTTGYGTANFAAWPSMLPFLLIFGSFMGGCAGSTGGGIKVIRVLLMYKQGLREVKRLIHPNAVILVKIGTKPVPDRVIEAVWGFMGVYFAMFIFLMLVIMATGLDFHTSFSAVAASINNLGPGLGDVAKHYGEINNYAKWILCFSMLLGRLEVFTLLVLFSPLFWRK